MKRLACITAMVLVLLAAPGKVCGAPGAKLLGMSSSSEEGMNRVGFIFDRLPKFDVSQSGQRVRVVMFETGFAGTFKKAGMPDTIEPLISVKTKKYSKKSVIELFFRDIPKFVDVTMDKRYARLNVNIFWDRKNISRRPAVLGRRFGRLKPIKNGAAAEKVISSEYAGSWIDFFREFERPPGVRAPVSFSMPCSPCPAASENWDFYPRKVRDDLKCELWADVCSRLEKLLDEDTGGRRAALFILLTADCLLRQGKPEKASAALNEIDSYLKPGPLSCWSVYYKSVALASRGRVFLADHLAEKNRQKCLEEESLEQWFRLLESELDLAAGMPEKALEHLESGSAPGEGRALKLYRLRKAQCLYEKGRIKKACQAFLEPASDLRVMQRHPAALAACCSSLYRQKKYGRAYRYFFLLSGVLEKNFPEKRAMADYWSAMAGLHCGRSGYARFMLKVLEKDEKNTDAGLLARLKLMDLRRLSGNEKGLESLVSEYDRIAESAETRQVREEAFFKKIVSCHLEKADLRAVKMLGRFFDDYWAGSLQPEARALFVEIFPAVVNELVECGDFFEVLTLVDIHRELLAQARITYGFLYDLAESYEKAGFMEQAVSTYLYLLDFEKSRRKKSRVYLPLIRILHQEGKYERLQRYGSTYLNRYPGGADRAEILYYYADARFRLGDYQAMAERLDTWQRPQTAKLDRLAGEVFYEMGRFDKAARYLERLWNENKSGMAAPARLKLAEALFEQEEWGRAVPVYRSLAYEQGFAGQASYRLVQCLLQLRRKSEALNLYQGLAEKEIGDRWIELAGISLESDGIK